MKSNKIVALGAASLAVVALAACSNRSANRSESAADSIRVAYVTDTGGVDDHSFNESAWTGLKAWGEENKLEQNQGYTYYQSENESDFTNNFQQAITEGYDMVAGAGFALATSLEEVAKNNPDTKFVM
ncbi:BMP family ABC transporter substrate-binding protein, partial [Streptococcus danieliae]|nr:BMP family ABC transporter substrate-binding protein [Streptococcus danieliae]